MAGSANGINGQVPQVVGKRGDPVTPQRRYYPASEQHTGMSTMDMLKYTNPFTGEEQTGSSTSRNHLNAMAEKYGTDGDWMDGVDRNAASIQRANPMPMPMPTQGFNVNQAAAQGIQQAQQGASSEMGYRPMAIGAPSQANLQQYTNPYETQVVNQSLADLDRSRLMAQNVGGAQASAANAYGGSRQGIAEAETNRGYAEQAARMASGLRQTGYQNAQNMARQASMQNQQAGLQGSQQRLNAGSQLGNLSNLGFGMGQTIQGNMDRQGMMQQALNQQLINDAKGQYAGYTGAPAQSLQYLLQAVGGAPNVGTQTSGYSPGLFDYLTLGAKAASGSNFGG